MYRCIKLVKEMLNSVLGQGQQYALVLWLQATWCAEGPSLVCKISDTGWFGVYTRHMLVIHFSICNYWIVGLYDGETEQTVKVHACQISKLALQLWHSWQVDRVCVGGLWIKADLMQCFPQPAPAQEMAVNWEVFVFSHEVNALPASAHGCRDMGLVSL